MPKITEEIKKKKKELVVTLIYLLIIVLLHWKFRPDLQSLFFLGGGVLGVYFLSLADLIFKISPSPYRNVFFQAAFAVMALFVLTSSGSLFGNGLVLAVYLSMIMDQTSELKGKGNLNGWFSLIKKEIKPAAQMTYFCVINIVFILLNLLFV